jgi:hypothetical protein
MAELKSGDRVAGIALIAGAAASMLAMAHHPTGMHGGAMIGIVHGAMIVLVALMAFGFAHFSRRRGLGRPAVLAGLVAYGIGLSGHIGAATINGFVAPALAANAPGASHDVFVLAWEANQVLARLGVIASGAAFLSWSIDFLGRPGAEAKVVGALGLIAGAVPAALLMGGMGMHLAQAFAIYGGHAAWAALVGLHVLRGGLD